MRAGDILVTVNGEYVVVEKIEHELLDLPETTYNFEVKDFHTYYVGSAAVLVHNKCGKVTNAETKKSAEKLGYTQVKGQFSHGDHLCSTKRLLHTKVLDYRGLFVFLRAFFSVEIFN